MKIAITSGIWELGLSVLKKLIKEVGKDNVFGITRRAYKSIIDMSQGIKKGN